MRTAQICPTCSTYTNAVCVLYDGPYLTNLDIDPLTPLDEIIQKVDETVGNLEQNLSSEKQYVVNFDQVLGDPSVQVFKNTLSAPIVWTRTGVGNYEGVLVGEFPASKTFIPQNLHNFIPEDKVLKFFRQNDDTIVAECRTISTGTPVDLSMVGIPLEIRIYP